jgi:hypothetical protein
MTNLDQTRWQAFKAGVEYMKHIITLSAGSIVVIAGFISKQKDLANKWCVAVSLIGFVAAVVLATGHYTIGLLYYHPGRRRSNPTWLDVTLGLMTLLLWVSFLVGIISLAVFGISNA